MWDSISASPLPHFPDPPSSALAIVASPTRYAPVTLASRLANCRRVPMGDHFAAAHARAGAEIDDVVGGAHRVFVVLDHDDRVALIAQPLERRQQPIVVARVQSDRRFVEDVQHADQSAADLPGEANSLCLAAGERRGRAVERQIVEPDVA